ncbi:DUF4232 domain-containing protein [Streptomyces sp. NPDC058953]|uniref:DUF4232 domain-containing protein n=1 Tax=unclassified Streptomyces TaxID=2593676 RepID=UPI00368889E8
MSSIRNSRTRLIGTVAVVTLAALSLTACQDGTGTDDEGASAATVTPAGTPGSGRGEKSGEKSGAFGDSEKVEKVEKEASGGSSGETVTCEGSNTKTVAAPLNRPINHMLLTVTNTGSRPCSLYGYPAVRFGEAQSVPPVIAESKPQAVVTLAPGESGYAGVALSADDGNGSGGRTEKSLIVHFSDLSGNGSVGESARPSLPARGVHIDDSLEVTYWQQEMDNALSW